jgi:hypothetical protein
MKLKKISKWAIGGIIGVIIELIFFAIFLLFENTKLERLYPEINSFLAIIANPTFILFYGFFFGDNITSFFIYLSYLLSILLYFVIGVIMTLFFFKIRKRKNNA